MFQLTPKDLSILSTVETKLAQVIIQASKTAATPFRVLEGFRTAALQAKYFKAGSSKKDGVKKISNHQLRRAVDIVPLINGKPEFRSWVPYYPMATNIKAAAAFLKVRIGWGGDWRTFKDGPHFELI